MKTNSNNRKALGRGLEQLFTNEHIDFDNFENEIVSSAKKSDIVEIDIDEIRSNPYQPRKTFNDDTLQELADSIKEHGVVQPVIVKKSIKGYELIAGERRTKASKLAGLKKVPAIIRDFDDEEMMEIALIENIQRENLNPIEEAMAYESILEATKMTQEELATKFGKSRTYITNMLGLLKLPEDTKESVIKGDISMSHARVLSKLDDPEEIKKMAKKVMNEKMNVRELEDLSRKIPMPHRVRRSSDNYIIYENIMRDKIGTKVRINNHKIEIPFDSEKDLERILEIIDIRVEGD